MGNELATIKGGPLAIPEHLREVHGDAGLENVGREDIILPRLSICQSTTPQRKKANPSYIEGLEEGQLFNTVTGDIYGTKVDVIPVLFAKSRIYFKKLEEGGGILCQSFNGIDGGVIAPKCSDCPNSKFGADKPPLCTSFMNFPSILVGSKNMIAASFKSTALKAARGWVTRMKMFDKPSYAAVYEINLVADKNSKGEFFKPVINFKRWTTADEFAFAAAQFNALKGRVIKTDEVEPDEANDPDLPF